MTDRRHTAEVLDEAGEGDGQYVLLGCDEESRLCWFPSDERHEIVGCPYCQEAQRLP